MLSCFALCAQRRENKDATQQTNVLEKCGKNMGVSSIHEVIVRVIIDVWILEFNFL